MSAVYEWVRDNVVNAFNFVSGEYWSNNFVVYVLFIACLTLLFLGKGKIKRGYDSLAVYSVLLIALFLLNPLALRIYGDIREAFVLLPMGVMISCVISSKSTELVSKAKKTAVIISLTALIIIAGLVMRTEDMVSSVNFYKVDDQGIITAQYILDDCADKPVTACYVLRDDENHGADVSAYEAAVQYSGKIFAVNAAPADEQIWNEADYIVISNDLLGAMNITGFDTVADAGSYTVLSKA